MKFSPFFLCVSLPFPFFSSLLKQWLKEWLIEKKSASDLSVFYLSDYYDPTTAKHLDDIAHFVHVRQLLVSKSFLSIHKKNRTNNFVFDRLQQIRNGTRCELLSNMKRPSTDIVTKWMNWMCCILKVSRLKIQLNSFVRLIYLISQGGFKVKSHFSRITAFMCCFFLLLLLLLPLSLQLLEM